MPRYTKVATFHSTRRSFRLIIFFLLLFIVSLLSLRKLCEFNGKSYCFHKAEPPSYLEKIKPPVPHRSPVNTKGPIVNLVVGTVLGDDISWTSEITIPNLKIIRYVWDDPKAEYHPARKRGREAMMYHTYFRDFYDNLPDISILIHPHERPWHAESFLFNSLSYTISSLDLDQVVKRKYVNLRIGWQDGCPNWINTTVSTTDSSSTKQEEPFMRQAFLDNFASRNFRGTKGNLTVPEIFAQPCCSQFAVTRDAIRAIPLNEYSFYIEWLSKTPLPDQISGRVWEHFWQYLFTGKAVDCPIEWKTLCRMYGVCFENPSEMKRFRQLETEKDWLIFGLRGFGGFWRELRNPDRVGRERGRIRDIDVDMGMRLGQAVNKGLEQGPPAWRDRMGDLYKE